MGDIDSFKTACCSFLDIPDIKLSHFQLILDDSVKNRGILEKIECEPREENKSEDGSYGKKYTKKKIISNEFPFTPMEFHIFVFFEDFEGFGEFFKSSIKIFGSLQELLLSHGIEEEFFFDKSYLFYDLFFFRFFHNLNLI